MPKKASAAQRKNKNATTVVRQKRKAKKTAKKAATKLERSADNEKWSKVQTIGESRGDHGDRMKRAAARLRKKKLKAGKIRRSAASIK